MKRQLLQDRFSTRAVALQSQVFAKGRDISLLAHKSSRGECQMDENERFRLLFGPYAAPQFEYGQIMHCELHGDVIACGMSAGPIPWPIGKYSERGNTRFFILTGDLVRAVRQEAAIVVCHWWGVKQCCVTRWRKALGVGLSNEGTHLLRHKYSHEPGVRRGLEKAIQARKRAAASRRSGN